jgi:hypothetical protein
MAELNVGQSKMNTAERPSLMPLVIATLCAIVFAALGCFRLVEEWKMSADEGLLLFGKMMFGPFSRVFLNPGRGMTSVATSPVLVLIALLCLFSFVLPAIRKKKSSTYIAAAGSVAWIMSGVLIIVGAGM